MIGKKKVCFTAMNYPRSIKQIDLADVLPNFRNLGVTLRILLICLGMAVLQAVLSSNAWVDVPGRLLDTAVLLTPILLASLLLLWVFQPYLLRLSYGRGVLLVIVLVLALTLLINYIGNALYRPAGIGNRYFESLRLGLLSVIESGMLLVYFRIRSQKLSHALHDARLQVLRARIRPHFLFNSINAVLGIVRTRPKQAEEALEDMADLFRMAMTEGDDLVPLRQEIQLCKQYLALEKLRMGDRLRVDWRVREVPENIMVPPLLLQPLLENAVYHGIEPMPQGGVIDIELLTSSDNLYIKVSNPRILRGENQHHGNKVALRNIRERLDLLFDAEARYKVESGKDDYSVEIVMPCIKEKTT